MNTGVLDPRSGMGAVHIGVTSADRAIDFYREVVGLQLLEGHGQWPALGLEDRPLVVLHPGADGPVPAGRTGLYHLALVVPGLRDLAVVIKRLMELGYPNSPTDHVMTKSDYLWDPDGNGIEIYAETPEDGTWVMSDTEFGAIDARGRPRSGRDPIHLGSLFGLLDPDERLDVALPARTRMGHVHLHVRDVQEAVRFYAGQIGFEVMGASLHLGVAFVAAGGYHHHIGLNTWAGAGAPPAPSSASGLRHFTLIVPDKAELDRLATRLHPSGEPAGRNGLEVRDPSGNKMVVEVAA